MFSLTLPFRVASPFVPLIFKHILANHFSHTVFNNMFHPFPSHNYPIELFQTIFQLNFLENFYTKFFYIILHQVFQLICTPIRSYTQFFHTLCQSILPTLLPYSLNTAIQILYTESLTHRKKEGNDVGGEEKLLYMGDSDIINICTL